MGKHHDPQCGVPTRSRTIPVSDMLSGTLRHFTLTVLSAALLFAGSVRAQTTGEDATRKAATLFDEGVRQFSHGQFSQAARAFLAADEAAPSQEAITNAMNAALKAELYVLAARAAERALSRASSDESTRNVARSTLSKVTPKLARLEIACGPAPCSVELDGEPVPLGVSYVLPGTHEVVGRNTEGQRATAQVGCAAATPCRVMLEAPPVATTQAPPVPLEEPAPSAPEAQPAPDAPAEAPAAAPAGPRRSKQERLALGLFVGSGAAALTLAAVTVWSGVDALRAHDDAEKNADWKPQAQRTDALLGVTIALAAASVGTGIWWGKIRTGRRTTLALLPARGLMLSAEARF
jgi:hypothetical protein